MTTQAQGSAPPKRRRSRKTEPDILALKRFAKVMEGVDRRTRLASIAWLADRYLGIQALWRLR
jgi:hypothetical protein